MRVRTAGSRRTVGGSPRYVTSISKTQTDRLGDRLRKEKVGDDELRQLDDFRRSFAGAYEEVVAVVRTVAHLEPTGRPAKSTTSIIEKLRRETIRLSQMQDIAGCRLVVQDVAAQDSAVAQLKVRLPGAVVVDRRKQPSHGYRAVHIIATAKGKPVEIQVRTELQHLWAQLSEKFSDVLDPAIKYGGGDAETQAAMSKIAGGIAELEALELKLPDLEHLQKDSPELQQRQKLEAEALVSTKKVFRRVLEETLANLEALSRKQAGD